MNLFKKKVLSGIYFLAMVMVVFFYTAPLGFFFFQDDFFEINISKAVDLKSYFDFFVFRDDIIAYRPISLQNYFFFSSYIFNFNPVGFRLISLTTLFLSSFLITIVVGKITKSTRIGLFSAFFWLTSSIHFMAITWIAAAYNIIGTFFFLLTSWIFLKFIEQNNRKYYLLSLISFLLTIGSFEFSITWPFIFFMYLILNKQHLVRSVKILAPFFVFSAAYLIARFLFIKIPQIVEYQLGFNIESLKAFFWYILWSFNIPEEFKKQVTHNLFFFNSDFLREFWPLLSRSLIFMLWTVTLTFLLPIYLIFKKEIRINSKILVFFAFWFVFAISPVLLLPNHTFIMYLTLSSIGIYSSLAYLLISTKSPTLVAISLAIWIASTVSTINFYKENFWMIDAQRAASKVTVDLKTRFPNLPKNSAVLYRLNSNKQIQALSNMESIRAVYNDQSLLIYYNKDDLIKDYKSGKIHGTVFVF